MRNALTLMFIASVLSCFAPASNAWSKEANTYPSQISREIARFEADIKAWSGDIAALDKLKADVDEFAHGNPDNGPAQVLAAIVDWIKTSQGFGVAHASESFLPLFLQLQDQAPDYPDIFLSTARAYIFTGDLDGALPSLNIAMKMAPDDPWVDLTWALLYDRMKDGKQSAKWAQSAIPKASDDPYAIGTGIAILAKHYGLADMGAVEAMADQICTLRCDPGFVAPAMAKAIDAFSYQPGLLDTVAELARRSASRAAPTPQLYLQWARAAILLGDPRGSGAISNADPTFAVQAKEILASIKDDPAVAQDVWGVLFDIALQAGDVDEASALIAQATARGYPATTVAYKTAALLLEQKKIDELVQLYARLRLPPDGLLADAKARGGDFEAARMYYERSARDNPTNPYILGDLAGFILFYFEDPEEAARYATTAYELAPYPLVRETLAASYLSMSGKQLRVGALEPARDFYRSANQLSFDRQFVMRLCWRTCSDMEAALRAFD